MVRPADSVQNQNTKKGPKKVFNVVTEAAIVKEAECLNGEGKDTVTPLRLVFTNRKSVLLDVLAHPLNIPL